MSIHEIERQSIEAVIRKAAHDGLLSGRVLDFGAGRQPYRKIIEEAGGDYMPFDRMHFPGSTVDTDVGRDEPLEAGWNAIVCTQVLQYVGGYVVNLLSEMYDSLGRGGALVLTGPTNWPVVETTDLQRFTVEGVVHLLRLAGFEHIDCNYRGSVKFEGWDWPLGWAAIARRIS